MIKGDPRELVETLIHRSGCSVKVAAVIEDNNGVFSWGWNHMGAGFGEHAEVHAIKRANRARLKGSTIYVAGIRERNKKPVGSPPCLECLKLILKHGISEIWYRDKEGKWQSLH